jgi:hypothetical protein
VGFSSPFHAELGTRITASSPSIRGGKRPSTATAVARGNIQIVRCVQIVQIVGVLGRLGADAARGHMAVDLVIDIENTPGALARVAAAISDAGVNIAAATCIGPGERAQLHILVPHAGAVKHSLAISHLAVTGEREVVVVDVEDRPGVLADLTRKIARAGVDLDLIYVATRNRVVFGAADLDALKAALDAAS